MRNIFHFFLVLSFIGFTACTTLNGAEQCALIGQIQEGTQIGTRTNVRSFGDSIYTYHTTTYNPICKIPKTVEEEEFVSDLYPIAKDKKDKRNKELLLYYVGAMVGAFGLWIVVWPSYNLGY